MESNESALSSAQSKSFRIYDQIVFRRYTTNGLDRAPSELPYNRVISKTM